MRRVREVLEVIWKGRADTIEKEACDILGVKELRDYFRKPERRLLGRSRISLFQKPPKGPDLLAAAVLQEELRPLALLPPARQGHALQGPPELRRAQNPSRGEPLNSLRAQKAAAGDSGKAAKKVDKDIERPEDFLSELRDFEDKLGGWQATSRTRP